MYVNLFKLSALSLVKASFQLFKKQLILKGHIFDCIDYKQADTLSKYLLGVEYKHGGDIQLPYPQAQPL
jgi:hypothetical protein